MTNVIPVTEFARHLSDYLARVAYKDESFVVTRGGRPVARVVPIIANRPPGEVKRPRGLSGAEFLEVLRSLPKLDPEEAAAFADDIEAAQAEANSRVNHDPWAP